MTSAAGPAISCSCQVNSKANTKVKGSEGSGMETVKEIKHLTGLWWL